MATMILKSLQDITPCVEKVLQEDLCHITAERRLDVKLCLFELLSNAFMHSDMPNVSKAVTLQWIVTPNTITIQVLGNGRCWFQASSNLSDAAQVVFDPLSEHGRGLMLVAAVAERLWFCDETDSVNVVIRW